MRSMNMNNNNRRLKVTSEGLVIDITDSIEEIKSIPFPALEQEFIVEAIDEAGRLFNILPAKKGDNVPNEFKGAFTKPEAISRIKFYRDRLKSQFKKPTRFPLKSINVELIQEAKELHSPNRTTPNEGWELLVEDDGTEISIVKQRIPFTALDKYVTCSSWAETDEIFKDLGMELPKDYTKHYKATHKEAS